MKSFKLVSALLLATNALLVSSKGKIIYKNKVIKEFNFNYLKILYILYILFCIILLWNLIII